MRCLDLIWLKMKSLGGKPAGLIVFVLLPLLLSLPTGLAMRGNEAAGMTLGCVDLAQNEDSRQFVSWLLSGGVHWQEFDEEGGKKALGREEIAALLRIPENFNAAKRPTLVLVSGSAHKALGLVLEESTIALNPLLAESLLEKSLMSVGMKEGISEEKVKADFRAELQRKAETAFGIRMKIEGAETHSAAQPLLFIPEYNIELLFLSLFAVLGRFGLAERSQREKVRRLPGGLFLDSFSEILALLLLGLAQICLLNLGFRIFFPEAEIPLQNLFIMLVYLLSQLAFTSLTSLLPPERRMMTALLLLVFSACAGGCFFQLPAVYVRRFGQYFPHGWALYTMQGMKLASPLFVLGLSLLLLFAGCFLSARIELKAA